MDLPNMTSPDLDMQKIRDLIDLMESSGISELELKQGDQAVRIVRPLPGTGAVAMPSTPIAPAAGHVEPDRGEPVRAPMAGTFYSAAEPGAEPFVREGSPVSAGDVLCIIESMKMMNEIKADRSGVCTAVTAENGQPVGAGSTLFRIA